MTELKPGWQLVALGDVVEVITDYWDRDPSRPERFIAGEHIVEGQLRISRWGMTDDELVPPTFNRRFKAGDVLFHSRNIRKLAQPDFGGITGEKIFVLRTRNPLVLMQELLPFLLQMPSFSDYTERMWAGSTNKFLNKAPLLKYEFTLRPMEEQRRISKTLQGASALTNEFINAVQVAESARDSLVVELYKYGIRREPTKMTNIGLVPRSWSIETLGNRYSIQLGKMISKAARLDESDGSRIPYLRNANVQWNKFELDDVATMAFTEAERKKFSLLPGDILACEGRHVGKSAIWRNEIPGACYQKALHRLRATGSDMPEFLLHCLYFFSITGRFAALTGETTIPHLPAERLRAIPVAFPSVEEQEEIVRVIASFDDGLQLLTKRAERAKSLIGSLNLESR